MKITMQGLLHKYLQAEALRLRPSKQPLDPGKKKKQVDKDDFTLVRSKWAGNLSRAELTPRW